MSESNIFDIDSNFLMDSKITKIEYYLYVPYIRIYNNNDKIRISVQQINIYPLPFESFLFIEGKVADVTKVKFVITDYLFFLNKYDWK